MYEAQQPLLRARFCELIAEKVEMRSETNDLFLLGLLSVMDVLLNMRMSDVFAEIPVDDEIRRALLGRPSRYRPIFEVVLDYESARWSQLAHSAHNAGVHEHALPDLYINSVPWAAEVLADVPSLV